MFAALRRRVAIAPSAANPLSASVEGSGTAETKRKLSIPVASTTPIWDSNCTIIIVTLLSTSATAAGVVPKLAASSVTVKVVQSMEGASGPAISALMAFPPLKMVTNPNDAYFSPLPLT